MQKVNRFTIGVLCIQERRQKIFQRGPIRIKPVLTTENERIFEICKVLERVCENPEGALALRPCRRPCVYN